MSTSVAEVFQTPKNEEFSYWLSFIGINNAVRCFHNFLFFIQILLKPQDFNTKR